MLNWQLLRNPLNWFVVFLMVALGVMGLHVVASKSPLFNNQ